MYGRGRKETRFKVHGVSKRNMASKVHIVGVRSANEERNRKLWSDPANRDEHMESSQRGRAGQRSADFRSLSSWEDGAAKRQGWTGPSRGPPHPHLGKRARRSTGGRKSGWRAATATLTQEAMLDEERNC